MFSFCRPVGQTFNGFGDLGDIARPSFDYVRAGDVIRVSLFLDAGFSAPPISAFRDALGRSSALRLLRIDQSRLSTVFGGYSGSLVLEVQTLSDFAKLDDVVRLVAGIAQQAGLYVLISGMRGEFVSQVETTAGVITPSIPAPVLPSPGSDGNIVSDFFGSLTQSPVTLAVIAGAAVILVIAAKK